MKHSEQPKIELEKSLAAIGAMKCSASLDEFEENWKIYLRHIERIWNKSASHYSKSPKWNGWKGRFEQLRKKDPLLSYLINARGAEEHTVNEIISREPGGIAINPAEGNILEMAELSFDNGNVKIKSSQKLRIDFIPARTKLLPIVNRGREYPVPTMHLGNRIDPSNVIEIAEIAFEFYRKFVSESEIHFVK